MVLELSEDEAALVRMIVKWRLAGLTMEIDHTDSREYREHLKKQRTDLERLSERLG